MRVRSAIAVAIVGFGVGAVLWSHNVDAQVTPSDVQAIRAIVGDHQPRDGTQARDLAIIRHVQRAVLDVAPLDTGIPYNQPREPADLLRSGAGLCYDRSRTIEKALRHAGFATRHVFLWRRGYGSHAVSDVLTVDGWLRVDSNEAWVSVDGPPPNPIYGGLAIIGLYSQHGRFYAPFTPIPDVNWRELVGGGVGWAATRPVLY